jgi:hypothetical protein
MNHQFVIVWDCNGLEYIEDLTEIEHNITWSALQGKTAKPMPNLNHLTLRARYNSQRHYEIYIIEATEGITKDDIAIMFEENPQQAADTIRRLGKKLYSDRVDLNRVKIV